MSIEWSRSQQNITAVRESVVKSPETSIRHHGQEFDIKIATLQRILTKDFRLHAYKIQFTQQLLPTYHAQRREFISWILEQPEVNANIANKIIFNGPFSPQRLR